MKEMGHFTYLEKVKNAYKKIYCDSIWKMEGCFVTVNEVCFFIKIHNKIPGK